jgi:glycosyltransferase involved in cell wall biosynthesis
MKFESHEVSISFFVPTFNEASNIKNVLDKLSFLCSSKDLDNEIIVIDDCSSDDTLSIINTNLINYPHLNIKLIANTVNVGLGTNFFKAVSIAQKQYFRLVNGDDVETIDTHLILISLLGKTELVIPFYFKVLGRDFFRETLSKLYTFILNLITGYDLKYYNGAPIYDLKKLKSIIVLNSSMSYSAETLVRFLKLNPAYQEVGLLGIHRPGSRSMTLSNFKGAFNLFLRLFLLRIFK